MRRLKRVAWVVLLSGSFALGGSQEGPRKPGDLGAVIVIGSSPDYIREWGARPRQVPGRVPQAREFAIGETAYVAFVATGYARTPEDLTDLRADVRIVGPDGSVRFDLPGYSRLRREVPARGFVMLDPALDYITEPGDLTGAYRNEVLLADLVSGRRARASRSFVVTPGSQSARLRGRLEGEGAGGGMCPSRPSGG